MVLNGKTISLIKAVADTVQEMGTAPNGILYAALMNMIDLETYKNILGILERAGLIKVSDGNCIISWIGPKKV